MSKSEFSIGQFSVDSGRFYRPFYCPTVDLSEISSPKATFANREKDRFFMIDSVDGWLSSVQAAGQKKIKVLETAVKVATIFIYVIRALLPLGLLYLPAWVPWGIAIPSMIILAIVQAKLQSIIESGKQNNQFVPLFREFLRHHSEKVLHPIGEWDLPEVDERCKSDEVAKNALYKKHPQSGKAIEKILNCYNLDTNPYVMQHVAVDFASIPKREECWKEAQTTAKESMGDLRKGNTNDFIEKRGEVLQTAYQNLHELDFLPPSARSQVETLISPYITFCRLNPEVEDLYKKGKKLWKPLDFLGEPWDEMVLRYWEMDHDDGFGDMKAGRGEQSNEWKE